MKLGKWNYVAYRTCLVQLRAWDELVAFLADCQARLGQNPELPIPRLTAKDIISILWNAKQPSPVLDRPVVDAEEHSELKRRLQALVPPETVWKRVEEELFELHQKDLKRTRAGLRPWNGVS